MLRMMGVCSPRHSFHLPRPAPVPRVPLGDMVERMFFLCQVVVRVRVGLDSLGEFAGPIGAKGPIST